MSAAAELAPGPEPYLATCERCGERIPRPSKTSLPLKAFLAEIEAIRLRHTSCQEAGDGEDEAALRRAQPQAGEDADEEAERTSPPPADGAPPAPGGVGAGEDHSQCHWCNTMLDSFAEYTGIDLRPVSR